MIGCKNTRGNCHEENIELRYKTTENNLQREDVMTEIGKDGPEIRAASEGTFFLVNSHIKFKDSTSKATALMCLLFHFSRLVTN